MLWFIWRECWELKHHCRQKPKFSSFTLDSLEPVIGHTLKQDYILSEIYRNITNENNSFWIVNGMVRSRCTRMLLSQAGNSWPLLLLLVFFSNLFIQLGCLLFQDLVISKWGLLHVLWEGEYCSHTVHNPHLTIFKAKGFYSWAVHTKGEKSHKRRCQVWRATYWLTSMENVQGQVF